MAYDLVDYWFAPSVKQYKEAFHWLRIARRHADSLEPRLAADNLFRQGNVLRHLERFRGALVFYRRYLPEADTAERRDWVAEAFKSVGIAAHHMGQVKTALAAFEEALAVFRTMSGMKDIPSTLVAMGETLELAGDDVAARACYEEAIDLLCRYVAEESLWYASAAYHLGDVLYKQGECEPARQYLNRSLGLRKKLDDPVGIADCLCLLGTFSADMGDVEIGKHLIEDGIERYPAEEMKEPSRVAARGRLADLLARQGNFQAARLHYEEGLEFWRAEGQNYWIASFLIRLGRLCLLEGRWDEAQEFLTQALDLYCQLGCLWGQTSTQESLAALADARLADVV